MQTVYMAMPLLGDVWPGAARAFFRLSTRRKMNQILCPMQGSLLAHTCNLCWCAALNRRQSEGVTHFAMLHSDIEPDMNWLDTLLDEMERTDADVMSAVVPIKDDRGLTSTAINIHHEIDPELLGWDTQRRLSMAEVMSLPETFSSEDIASATLLVNTGCFVCRLDRSWCEQITWEIRNRIVRLEDGTLVPQVEPEDWSFSRQVARAGGRIFATRKVRLAHVGRYAYGNDSAWGRWTEDRDCPGVMLDVAPEEGMR